VLTYPEPQGSRPWSSLLPRPLPRPRPEPRKRALRRGPRSRRLRWSCRWPL